MKKEYSKRFDLDLWKKLFQFARPYKRHFMGLAVVMIAVAGIDTVFPLLTKYVIDHLLLFPERLRVEEILAILYLMLISIQALNVLVSDCPCRKKLTCGSVTTSAAKGFNIYRSYRFPTTIQPQ